VIETARYLTKEHLPTLVANFSQLAARGICLPWQGVLNRWTYRRTSTPTLVHTLRVLGATDVYRAVQAWLDAGIADRVAKEGPVSLATLEQAMPFKRLLFVDRWLNGALLLAASGADRASVVQFKRTVRFLVSRVLFQASALSSSLDQA
jgi:hypothetical protein